MFTPKFMRLFVICVMLTLSIVMVNAQGDDPIIVPDLTGRSVPQAAAFLNDMGLQIGPEIAVGWTAGSDLLPNTIISQSISAGEEAAYGTVIGITVARAPNALLIYDDNDITLVNQAGGAISLGGVRFVSNGGAPQAAFEAGRWDASVGAGNCTQLWSVGRSAAKDIPECSSIRWITTNNPAEHFWTGANGAGDFIIVQDGIERAVCPVSATGRCEFFLNAATSSEIAQYIYMVYTSDRFSVFNNTTDQWMALNNTTISSAYAAAGTPMVSESFFQDEVNVVGYVEFLAPGQCIVYTNNADGAAAPQPCKEIGRASFNTQPTLFWNAEFSVRSVNDGEDHVCPAGQANRLTICILPR